MNLIFHRVKQLLIPLLLLYSSIGNRAIAENGPNELDFEQNVVNLIGKKLPDLNFSADNCSETDNSICSLDETSLIPTIVAVLDLNLLESHVQKTVFDRFARNHQTGKYRFSVLYLHKQPKQFLEYYCSGLISPYSQFAINRSIFSKNLIDPGKHALMLLLDRDCRIRKCIASYCNYEKMQTLLEDIEEPGIKSGGDLP